MTDKDELTETDKIIDDIIASAGRILHHLRSIENRLTKLEDNHCGHSYQWHIKWYERCANCGQLLKGDAE